MAVLRHVHVPYVLSKHGPALPGVKFDVVKAKLCGAKRTQATNTLQFRGANHGAE